MAAMEEKAEGFQAYLDGQQGAVAIRARELIKAHRDAEHEMENLRQVFVRNPTDDTRRAFIAAIHRVEFQRGMIVGFTEGAQCERGFWHGALQYLVPPS